MTASVGIAPNMSAAKIASDVDKPDGLVVVPPGEVADFLAPLAIETVHGVGPVRARALGEMGIETAGDLAAADPRALVDRFGERLAIGMLAVRLRAKGTRSSFRLETFGGNEVLITPNGVESSTLLQDGR